MRRRGAPFVAAAAVLAATAGFLAGRDDGGGAGAGALTSADRRAVAASVDSATRAFEVAERALDAAAVIAHLDPDFYMYVDGHRLGYDSVVANVGRTFAQARRYEPGFTSIEVVVQACDAAVASFEFRDALTDPAGAVHRFRGATTLVWALRDGVWKIIYADADHYPLGATGEAGAGDIPVTRRRGGS